MRLLRLLIGAILVFALLVIGGLFLLPCDRIARLAADELTRRTGREVKIAGEANVTLWPDLGVTVGALSIANADWSDNGPLFQAKSVTIGVDAAALIRKDIRIRTLYADNPQILLERNAQGAANWDLSPKPAGGSAPPASTTPSTPSNSPLPAFTLDRAEITDAAIFFADRQTGTEFNQRGIDLILAYPRANGPADIDLTLRPAGEPIRLTGTLADPVALAGSGVSGATFDIKAPATTARFDGRASLMPEVQGKIALDSSDTAALARAFGQAITPLPRGLGRSAKLNGEVTLTQDGALALRETLVTSGPNTLALAADLTTGGARPRLTAQLVAEGLDLTALSATSDGTPAPAAGGTPTTGWSTAPIDASALGLLDAEVSLAAKSIDLGTTKLGTTRALVTLDRARAVTTLREVQAFGGTLTGQFVANNRNGLSVGGDLQASEIALQQMLSELAGITRFTGGASGRVQFLGVGQSLAAIMNSLSGEGRIDTGRGTIDGIDLDRLFRGGDPTGGTTIFDATTATFTMAEGVLSNRDLLMKLAGIEAHGDGTIGLGQQQIDYLFTPVSVKARDGRGVALPVRIRGPWSKPRITVDVEKAIELNASEEKAKIEQKVKDEVAKKLGLDQQEGESAEDALKRKLEEEAKKGLLKLLER